MKKRALKAVRSIVFEHQVEAILQYHHKVLKRTLTYQDLTKAVGGHPHGTQLSQTLKALTEDAFRSKSPILTALVVQRTTGVPGNGFFAQMAELGYRFEPDPKAWWLATIRSLGCEPVTVQLYLEQMLESLQDSEVVGTVEEAFEGNPAPQYLAGTVGSTTKNIVRTEEMDEELASLLDSDVEVTEDELRGFWAKPSDLTGCSTRTLRPFGFQARNDQRLGNPVYLPASMIQVGDVWQVRHGRHDPSANLTDGRGTPSSTLVHDADYRVMSITTGTNGRVILTLKDHGPDGGAAFTKTVNYYQHMRIFRSGGFHPPLSPTNPPQHQPAATIELPPVWVTSLCQAVLEQWPLQRAILQQSKDPLSLIFLLSQVLKRAMNPQPDDGPVAFVKIDHQPDDGIVVFIKSELLRLTTPE